MNTSAFHLVDLNTTDKDKKFEAAARMAAAIINLLQKQNNCCLQDLKAAGFEPNEVEAHWHLAHLLATTEIRLMNNKSPSNLGTEKRRAHAQN
jgi:hypothetical protein